MNIYKIVPKEGTFDGGWDTFDSAVVAAESPQEAQKIHPSDASDDFTSDTWVKDPLCVDVTLLGKAAKHVKKGVILASFNAG